MTSPINSISPVNSLSPVQSLPCVETKLQTQNGKQTPAIILNCKPIAEKMKPLVGGLFTGGSAALFLRIPDSYTFYRQTKNVTRNEAVQLVANRPFRAASPALMRQCIGFMTLFYTKPHLQELTSRLTKDKIKAEAAAGAAAGVVQALMTSSFSTIGAQMLTDEKTTAMSVVRKSYKGQSTIKGTRNLTKGTVAECMRNAAWAGGYFAADALITNQVKQWILTQKLEDGKTITSQDIEALTLSPSVKKTIGTFAGALGAVLSTPIDIIAKNQKAANGRISMLAAGIRILAPEGNFAVGNIPKLWRGGTYGAIRMGIVGFIAENCKEIASKGLDAAVEEYTNYLSNRVTAIATPNHIELGDTQSPF